ncbi:MAG: N utilization substance protein B [Candidatus Dojkabacteria bacterium]|nr:MAG: N utilization substance protein B [Candidatus Dojkabacteria bacterium]
MNNLQKIKDPRHLARLLAVQYLFYVTQAPKFSDVIDHMVPLEPNSILAELEETKFNTSLYEALVEGTLKYIKEIDPIIQKLAPSWPIELINPVDLNILRMAIYEGFIERRNPEKVVIDEAIELAKEMGSKENGAFVNGVLGSILDSQELKEKLANLYEKK